MHLPGLEKSWILGKMAEVMEKSWNFIFWSKDFVLFETWKNFPSHRAKICPQNAGFSAFLSDRRFKLVMKKSGHFIAQFRYEPCGHRIDYNGVGVLRSQQHIPSKT